MANDKDEKRKTEALVRLRTALTGAVMAHIDIPVVRERRRRPGLLPTSVAIAQMQMEGIMFGRHG